MKQADRKMAKADALAWKERWRRVNERQRQELQATTLEESFRQLASLMELAKQMGWTKSLREDDKDDRDHWLQLWKTCHG